MNLPQELLDEIFSHLPPYDTKSLKSYSLVSKSWVEPSRRLLFANVYIRLDTYNSWKNAISPTNTNLLRHVRSLAYFSHVHFAYPHRSSLPLCSFYALRDYLPSFSQLRTLTLYCINIEQTIFDNLELLSAFQHTLVSLTLSSVSATWSSFVVFAGHFPNLRNLAILGMSLEADVIPIPTIIHLGRGSLVVNLATGNMNVLCDRLAELKPEYNELRLVGGYNHGLIAAVERSLESLTLLTQCGPTNTPGLSRCPNLRQLSCATMQPQEEERTLISSITSTNFQKLIFDSKYFIGDSQSSDPCWRRLDDTLCELVDRLRKSGYKHTLEVEFQAEIVELDEDECLEDEFLSKFRERGRVNVIDSTTGGCWVSQGYGE